MLHSFGQGSCSTVVTIFDMNGNVLQTITNNPQSIPFAVSEGCIPPNVHEVRMTISDLCQGEQRCTHEPHFGATDFNSNGAAVIPGTEIVNSNNHVIQMDVEIFDHATSISLKSAQGCETNFKGSINFCSDPPPPSCDLPIDKCLVYRYMQCCDLNCIRFAIDCPKECENGCSCPECYFVTVLFDDGSVGTINLSFAGQSTLMNCFSKRIRKVLSVTPYECASCPPPRAGLKSVPNPEGPDRKQKDRVEVFPNPAKTLLNFKGDHLQDYKVSLYDSQGKIVVKDATVSGPVNIEKLSTGIYVFVITDQSGYKQTGKIVKE